MPEEKLDLFFERQPGESRQDVLRWLDAFLRGLLPDSAADWWRPISLDRQVEWQGRRFLELRRRGGSAFPYIAQAVAEGITRPVIIDYGDEAVLIADGVNHKFEPDELTETLEQSVGGDSGKAADGLTGAPQR
jgi:hypothetical protein